MKLTSYLRDTRTITLLILITSAWVWMKILPLYPPYSGQMVPDSDSYIEYAQQFIHHVKNDVVRTPGYPLLLLLTKNIASLSGISFLTITYLVQILLFITGLFLLSNVLRRMWNGMASICFVILIVLNPTFFIYNFLILTEPLFFFLISSSIYFFYQFIERQKSNAIYFSLFSTCLATLTRPGLYYLNLLYLAVIFFLLWKRKSILPICVCLAIYGSTVLTFQTNFYLHHRVFKISMIDEITRHRYLRNAIACETNGDDLIEQLRKQDSLDQQVLKPYHSSENQQEVSAYYHRHWNQTVRNHYGLSAMVFIRNILDNIHTGNTHLPEIIPKSNREKIFLLTRVWNMLYSIFFVLELTFLMIMIRRLTMRGFLGFLVLFVVYQIITSAVSFWQGDRLLAVCQPIILLMAFLFLASVWKRKNNTIRRQKFP